MVYMKKKTPFIVTLVLSFVCQNQDHYAVLGLVNVRYKATQKQIKAAREYFSSRSHGLLLLFLDAASQACSSVPKQTKRSC